MITAQMERSVVSRTARADSIQGPVPAVLHWLVLALAVAAGIAAVWGGPPLGDHEAIVAQCARSMRVRGDWMVPELFATPFIRKPPLAYWLVAVVFILIVMAVFWRLW